MLIDPNEVKAEPVWRVTPHGKWHAGMTEISYSAYCGAGVLLADSLRLVGSLTWSSQLCHRCFPYDPVTGSAATRPNLRLIRGGRS